jgi:hypothetical protein
MAQVTKYRCDHCKREVEDTYLVDGWIHVNGSISRSWAERKLGRHGDAQADVLEKNPEFCSIECLVAAFDAKRRQAGAPPVNERITQMVQADPFKPEPPPKPKPFEEPTALADDPK